MGIPKIQELIAKDGLRALLLKKITVNFKQKAQ